MSQRNAGYEIALQRSLDAAIYRRFFRGAGSQGESLACGAAHKGNAMFGTKRTVLKVLAAAAIILAAPLHARALDPDAARAHVEQVSGRLLDILGGNGPLESKRDAFRGVLTRDTAVEDIARIAIGRIWRAMPDEQRDRYRVAFIDYLTDTYSKRFAEFSGETITIGDATDAGKSGILVASTVVSADGRRRITVEWRVIERNGGPKVLDVYVEGASLLITQKSEFEAILERNGDDVDALIAQITQIAP